MTELNTVKDLPQPVNVENSVEGDGDDESRQQFVMMDLEDGGVDVEKRPRKMTSNSDGTSVTALSSFLDDSGGRDDDNVDADLAACPSKDSSKLDSLHEHEDDEDDYSSGGSSGGGSSVEDSRCWIWFKRFLLFWVIFGVLGFAVVMIGAAMEKRKFADAQGTGHLYQMPEVCGVEDPLTATQGTTFASVTDAHDNGAQIAHCGDCGACSTAQDMEIMTQTADSLTDDSTRCAFKIFIGRRAVEKCMEERVGFTPACEDCWLDNISCSFKACKFTCIKHKLFRKDNNKGEDQLNDCLKCDERMCGPQFIECSGANRRRMGIVSDIGRNAADQCLDADVDWLTLYD